MDAGLLTAAVIVPCLLVVANLVLLAKYIDPQHAAGHYTAKLALLFGLTLAEGTILLLPLDVGNRAGVVGCGFYNNNCGGLDLKEAWKIIYGCIAACVAVVLPFLIYWYEADDEGLAVRAEGGGTFAQRLNLGDCKRSLMSACCYECITLAIAIPVLFVTWRYLGIAQLPVRATFVDIASNTAFINYNTTVDLPCGGYTKFNTCVFDATILELTVSFIVYLAALISFIGWFLFVVYVGIGFIGLPLDLYNGFKHRPKVFSKAEEVNAKNGLRKKAEDLVAVGEKLGKDMIQFKEDGKHSRSERRKQAALERRELNQYRVLVDALEKELEEFDLCCAENYREHYNPFVPWLKLVGCFVSAILTVLWILHIFLYMIFEPAISLFLNKFLMFFDSFFPFFGTVSVAVFSMYLLIAAGKGNFKFGSRFFFITIHPMEAGKTLVNSFLFNLALIMLCVLPTVQFSTQAFSTYARLTDAEVLFSSTMRYLKFFKYFWARRTFLFCILIIVFISAVYFSVASSDRDHLKNVMGKIKAKKAGERQNVDRSIRNAGGAIEQEMPEWKSGKGRGRSR